MRGQRPHKLHTPHLSHPIRACVVSIKLRLFSTSKLRTDFGDMGDREPTRGARVYVGGLTDAVKKEDLESEFEKYGKVNSVWVAFNPPGFAFIEFSSATDAESACDGLNGVDLLGSKLRVEIARGKSRRGGMRGRGGPPSRGYDRPFSSQNRYEVFPRKEGSRDYSRRGDYNRMDSYSSRSGARRYRSRSPNGAIPRH